MSDTSEMPFTEDTIEAMNAKEVANQFFTPDQVYIELGLMKDLDLGAVYADLMMNRGDAQEFRAVQGDIVSKLDAYQIRDYDLTDPWLLDHGYSSQKINDILHNQKLADAIFLVSPATQFLKMLMRHTVLNQNHSKPAEKYTKRSLNKDQYTLDPIDVTYTINTWPLKVSDHLCQRVGQELGEALGVNIGWMCKDLQTLTESDWIQWMANTDAFYLHSLGRFNRSSLVLKKQGEMSFIGKHWFARKRLETEQMDEMKGEDYLHQITITTARLDMFCHFKWITNNDLRLNEDPISSPDTK